MKRISLYFLISIFVLGSMACSLGSVLDAGKETQNSAEITTEAILQDPTAVATGLPTSSDGFMAGTPLDASTLPALIGVGAGGEPTSCTSDNPDPSISLGYGMFPYQSLCLNNFPTAPDSSGITVTLVDPTAKIFSETFTYSPDGIFNSNGVKSGYIESGAGIDGNPGTPGVNLELYIPASLPCGEWTAIANTLDGSLNVGPSILSVDCSVARLSVLTEVSSNPFVSPDYTWDGPSFANTETLTVFGTSYPASTEIIVAFYQEDASAAKPENGTMQAVAKYAVTILTDGSGNFQVPFIIGDETQRGAYYVVAAPVIDPEWRLQPFGARFVIE
jgi:hypothetical protein